MNAGLFPGSGKYWQHKTHSGEYGVINISKRKNSGQRIWMFAGYENNVI